MQNTTPLKPSSAIKTLLPFPNIKNLSSNPLAKEVKLADLEHNMDLKRLPTLEEKDLERNRKYQIAYHYLINNK